MGPHPRKIEAIHYYGVNAVYYIIAVLFVLSIPPEEILETLETLETLG
jgi:hypothetical protein